jgi:hypothetical protein
MTTLAKDPAVDLFDAIASPHRSPEIPDADDLYGWLVGSWELDVRRYWADDVSAKRILGEVHAAWALEGRAVHDVWIMPRRADRSPNLDKRRNMYGTTLRAYDSSIRAWQILWSNPAGDLFERQIGRRSGNDIVQLGVRPDGTTTRWRFTNVTPNSFHWLGEAQAPDTQSWTLEGEFLATRTR